MQTHMVGTQWYLTKAVGVMRVYFKVRRNRSRTDFREGEV